MKKGITYGWQAILVASLVVVALGSTQAEGQKKIVFSTPIRTAIHGDLPGVAAEEKGFWKQMGLNVQWIPFGSGRAQSEALAAGSVDVSMTISSSGIRGPASGIPILIVADIKLRNDFFVWVGANSRIRRPQDLKGTKLGVSRTGSTAHVYGIVMRKKLGFKEHDIRIVGMGGIRAQVAALRKGAIDAVIVTQFVMFRLKHQGVVRDLVSMREYLPRQWIGNILVARRDLAARRPKDLKKVIKAYHLATDFVMNNPDWAVDKMKIRLKYTEGAARAIFPLLRWGDDWKTDPQALRNVRDFMVEYGIIKKSPKLEILYTNEFVS